MEATSPINAQIDLLAEAIRTRVRAEAGWNDDIAVRALAQEHACLMLAKNEQHAAIHAALIQAKNEEIAALRKVLRANTGYWRFRE